MRSIGLPELIFFWGLFWVFGWAILWMVSGYLRSRSKDKRLEMMHQERIAAMEKGIPLPELPDLDAYSRLHDRRPDSGLKGGIACVALGLGAMLAFRLAGNLGLSDAWSLPLPLVFLGLGLLLYHFLQSKKA